MSFIFFFRFLRRSEGGERKKNRGEKEKHFLRVRAVSFVLISALQSFTVRLSFSKFPSLFFLSWEVFIFFCFVFILFYFIWDSSRGYSHYCLENFPPCFNNLKNSWHVSERFPFTVWILAYVCVCIHICEEKQKLVKISLSL